MNSNKQKSRKRAAMPEIKVEKRVREESEAVEELLEDKAAQGTEADSNPTTSTKSINGPEKATPSTSSTTKKNAKQTSKPSKAKSPASSVKGPKPLNRSVLQLKITLEGITPPIWRRIQVLNNDNFFDLHQNINEAMGWMPNNSHQFIIEGPKKNVVLVNAEWEGLVYDFKKDRGHLFKEQTTKLSKYLSSPGDIVFYEYSLSESWIHKVVVERILPPPPPKAWYPKIKGGKRACPPEECGGVDGYNHLMEVYKDPNHEEYDELINGWLQEMHPGYDPEKFDRKNIFKRVWGWFPA